jgi:hypothetical protein
MTAFSDFLENALLNHILRGEVGATAFAQPAGIWMSLHSQDPVEIGSFEIAGGSYARKQALFAAPNAGVALTTNAQEFLNLPATNVTHVGLWGAVTGGNFLYGGALTPPKNVAAGDNITFNPGGFGVRHD